MTRLLLTILSAFLLFPVFSREKHSFSDGWLFKKAEEPPKTLNENWQPVKIPHTWNAEDMQVKKNIFYAGTAYYKKNYTPDISLSGKRIFLRFEGVASVASIYVNGTFAGNHQGGYSAFVVEMTKLLKYGQENEILVQVDNASRTDVIPVNHTLFGVYGGIYRPVELIITEKLSITLTDYASPGIYISQKNVSRKQADISVKIKLENKNHDARDVRLITAIYETNGKIKSKQETPVTVLPQGRQFHTQNFVVKNPRLWQGLEDPYLYKVVTQLVAGDKLIDEVVQPLGIRHFELKTADGMYLNGRKVPMYGVCRHQDWWELGSALTDEQHDTDLSIIKEIGATTIRFAHYQQAERIYAKCDSIGFIVWAEIPFVNSVSTQEAGNAKQQLTELIRQNYNHPCIYVWGLHNEVYTPYNYTVSLTTDLNDLAKMEDPDRYTVSVSGYSTVNQESNLNADIQGINHYFGWYNGEIGDVEKWIKGMEKDFPQYKVIFSEYGAEANVNQQEETVGEFGRYFSQFYPETFATKFHEIHWGIIAQHPYLLASYVWNTFDFATPATTQGGIEARNMKGLVTFDRKIKKDPFYWYKANWSKEPVLYLTRRRACERENEITSVTVYSNIGTPRLFVNGTEITVFERGTTAVCYIFKDVKLKQGENTIVAKVMKDGKLHEDKIVWNYSPDNRKPDDSSSLQGIARTTEKKTKIPLKHGAHRTGKRTDEYMQRWREYGLGQFIHWGVYAIPGGQWNGKTTRYAAEWFRTSGLITKEEYDNLYKQFNPVKFDAVKWAKQAKQMGAKYMIFTTKHHDGFCMWPSKYTAYTIEATPYKKDILKEIVDAYRAEGIDVYLYFSIIDWSHPGYQAGAAITNDDKLNWASYTAIAGAEDKARYETFKEFTRNQLIELLTNYPSVKGLWFDGTWDGAWMKEAPWVDKLGTELRDMHPGLIIGSRFRADENGNRHVDTNDELIDDYDQRFERNLPNTLAETGNNDWDCVMTLPENQWGYHRDWSLSYVKTPYELIEMAVKANSLDGNFVINFGPDGEGNIRPEETKIAKTIGNWMAVNGTAIYGVQHSMLEKQDWGYSTRKEDTIYLSVFNKPMNDLLKVKVPKAKEKGKIYVIESARFIATKKKAVVRDGGRDKFGSLYYQILLPENIRKLNEPFVIEIRLKQVDETEKATYQQALT